MATLIDKNTVTLLRLPFSFLLMPLFLLALSQSGVDILSFNVIVSFLIIHLLVYPSSNGYNSYIDKDEESIGGIENPPLPTIQLFYVTLFLDALALILSFILIDWRFAVCIFVYILASRAYSSKTWRFHLLPVHIRYYWTIIGTKSADNPFTHSLLLTNCRRLSIDTDLSVSTRLQRRHYYHKL
jgi:hypothetical protein